jgi:hypothetical protein
VGENVGEGDNQPTDETLDRNTDKEDVGILVRPTQSNGVNFDAATHGAN